MGRYTDPVCRLCRREGKKLFLKGERCYSPKCPIEKKAAFPPGQHGPRGRRRISDYGRQLRAKQAFKRMYGVTERQLKNYFKRAKKDKTGKPGEVLLSLLESRLDNVLFRLGFVPSRSVSRQLVTHGHVLVDNKKVDQAGYQVKAGQIVTLSPKSLKLIQVKKAIAEKYQPPAWLKKKAAVGKMDHFPKREEIDTDIEEEIIVEFYSR